MGGTHVPGMEGAVAEMKKNVIIMPIGILAGLSLYWLLYNLDALGHNIPAVDIYSDYTIGVFWAMVMTLILLVLPLRERNPLLKIWVVKVFVVLVLMLFYERHYGLDAYSYFEEAVEGGISLLPRVGEGTSNIIRFNMLLIPLIGKSYHALKVVYSFLGLIGVYLFYRATVRYTGKHDRKILYLLALFPSILFWSSILGKEPVVLLILGLYTYSVMVWLKTKKAIYFYQTLLAIGLASFIRGWLAFIGGVPLLIMALLEISNPVRRITSILISAIFCIWAWSWFQDNFQLEEVRDIIDVTDSISMSWAIGGSGQELSGFRELSDMILFLPLGAFTALFRPLPWEAHNLFAFLSSIENTALLLFTLMAIKRFRIRFLKEPAVLWACLLILVWLSMYSFVSYQNLGTAVRFKLQILPVILILLYLTAWKRGGFLVEQLDLTGARK